MAHVGVANPAIAPVRGEALTRNTEQQTDGGDPEITARRMPRPTGAIAKPGNLDDL